MDEQEILLRKLENSEHDISVGDGDDKAMRFIQQAIINKERKIVIENLNLQTLYFFQFVDW